MQIDLLEISQLTLNKPFQNSMDSGYIPRLFVPYQEHVVVSMEVAYSTSIMIQVTYTAKGGAARQALLPRLLLEHWV